MIMNAAGAAVFCGAVLCHRLMRAALILSNILRNKGEDSYFICIKAIVV